MRFRHRQSRSLIALIAWIAWIAGESTYRIDPLILRGIPLED